MGEEGSRSKKTEKKSGLGVLCSEAQADGIPCPELDFDCEHCENADWKDDTEPDEGTGEEG